MKPARPKRTRQRAAVKAVRPGLSDKAIGEIETRIGHAFKDRDRLVRAMTHPSALSADEAVRHSNQRLEFLGDRVLGLVIAERLFERRPGEREGQLAPRLNRLVKKAACADAMRFVDLGPYIVMAPNEVNNGGREREGTLGDVCEAVIAAIYLDGGLKAARAFIEHAWAPQFSAAPTRTKDPKTLLQEFAQGRGETAPRYEVVRRTGPDHAPVFQVRVAIDGSAATADGPSKQAAERAAASALLDTLDIE